ncbi:MAG: DNA-3-methyladenine glycosylase I [Phycisphaerales bacterium]|nr:DNA-3-methyladenine glycosylase I [Phycisphaerales bacterium]
MTNKTKKTNERCAWARSEAEIAYHDEEWGVPQRGEHHLFEMLTLEGAQAGLSWSTILNKREGYRTLFKKFDPKQVAEFTQDDVERLMLDASIVRNRLKIESTINNAKAILELYTQGTTFSALMWGYVDDMPITNQFATMKDLPAQTDLSKFISMDLKKRGFRFVGPTVIYAMMQACGMVNDHVRSCPRHSACAKMK